MQSLWGSAAGAVERHAYIEDDDDSHSHSHSHSSVGPRHRHSRRPPAKVDADTDNDDDRLDRRRRHKHKHRRERDQRMKGVVSACIWSTPAFDPAHSGIDQDEEKQQQPHVIAEQVPSTTSSAPSLWSDIPTHSHRRRSSRDVQASRANPSVQLLDLRPSHMRSNGGRAQSSRAAASTAAAEAASSILTPAPIPIRPLHVQAIDQRWNKQFGLKHRPANTVWQHGESKEQHEYASPQSHSYGYRGLGEGVHDQATSPLLSPRSARRDGLLSPSQRHAYALAVSPQSSSTPPATALSGTDPDEQLRNDAEKKTKSTAHALQQQLEALKREGEEIEKERQRYIRLNRQHRMGQQQSHDEASSDLPSTTPEHASSSLHHVRRPRVHGRTRSVASMDFDSASGQRPPGAGTLPQFNPRLSRAERQEMMQREIDSLIDAQTQSSTDGQPVNHLVEQRLQQLREQMMLEQMPEGAIGSRTMGLALFHPTMNANAQSASMYRALHMPPKRYNDTEAKQEHTQRKDSSLVDTAGRSPTTSSHHHSHPATPPAAMSGFPSAALSTYLFGADHASNPRATMHQLREEVTDIDDDLARLEATVAAIHKEFGKKDDEEADEKEQQRARDQPKQSHDASTTTSAHDIVPSAEEEQRRSQHESREIAAAQRYLTQMDEVLGLSPRKKASSPHVASPHTTSRQQHVDGNGNGNKLRSHPSKLMAALEQFLSFDPTPAFITATSARPFSPASNMNTNRILSPRSQSQQQQRWDGESRVEREEREGDLRRKMLLEQRRAELEANERAAREAEQRLMQLRQQQPQPQRPPTLSVVSPSTSMSYGRTPRAGPGAGAGGWLRYSSTSTSSSTSMLSRVTEGENEYSTHSKSNQSITPGGGGGGSTARSVRSSSGAAVRSSNNSGTFLDPTLLSPRSSRGGSRPSSRASLRGGHAMSSPMSMPFDSSADDSQMWTEGEGEEERSMIIQIQPPPPGTPKEQQQRFQRSMAWSETSNDSIHSPTYTKDSWNRPQPVSAATDHRRPPSASRSTSPPIGPRSTRTTELRAAFQAQRLSERRSAEEHEALLRSSQLTNFQLALSPRAMKAAGMNGSRESQSSNRRSKNGEQLLQQQQQQQQLTQSQVQPSSSHPTSTSSSVERKQGTSPSRVGPTKVTARQTTIQAERERRRRKLQLQGMAGTGLVQPTRVVPPMKEAAVVAVQPKAKDTSSVRTTSSAATPASSSSTSIRSAAASSVHPRSKHEHDPLLEEGKSIYENFRKQIQQVSAPAHTQEESWEAEYESERGRKHDMRPRMHDELDAFDEEDQQRASHRSAHHPPAPAPQSYEWEWESHLPPASPPPLTSTSTFATSNWDDALREFERDDDEEELVARRSMQRHNPLDDLPDD